MARWWSRSASISASMSTSRRSRMAAAPPSRPVQDGADVADAEADLSVHADLPERSQRRAPYAR